ncbi:MAG: lysophospholipid acyltransferase family protein [Isosphaeraceae bacterium]
MARPRNRTADFLVYLFTRCVVCVAQMLSIEQSYFIARLLAWFFYNVDRRHRAVGVENLTHAFGDAFSNEEREEIVYSVYLHFCMVVMEIMHIPRKLDPTTWRDRITLVGHEKVLDLLLDGGPIIMLSGHFGNWEMAGYLFGVFGYPPNSVARTLDNTYLDTFLRKFRERTGQKMIPKNGGYDQMLEVLRSGGVLSFLADQDAGQRGLYVDFFGRPASTHKAIALLAIEHQAPVVFGYARRIGPGFRYEVGCEDVIMPSEWTGTPDDVRLITQRYTTALENVVRRSPEQYLWLHRRWKHQPKAKAKAAKTAVA